MRRFFVLKPVIGRSRCVAESDKRCVYLLSDFVLYAFRTELDECAMTATPLTGHTVLTGAQLRDDPAMAKRDSHNIIKMFVQQSFNGVNSSSEPSVYCTLLFIGIHPQCIKSKACNLVSTLNKN